MSRLNSIPDRALELAHGLKANVLGAMPSAGASWLKTGAALGIARTGVRVAGGFARRHPVALTALAVGAGALWLMSRKRNGDASGNGRYALDGQSTRVDAKRMEPNPRRTPGYQPAQASTGVDDLGSSASH